MIHATTTVVLSCTVATSPLHTRARTCVAGPSGNNADTRCRCNVGVATVLDSARQEQVQYEGSSGALLKESR